MTPRDVFQHYKRERREIDLSGYVRETAAGFTRYTPTIPDAEGFVAFATLSATEADAAIGEQIAHFRARGCGFEWKVYDDDTPADLPRRLTAAGFHAGETEAFLVYALTAAGEPAARPRFPVVRLTERSSLAHVRQIQEQVWGRSFAWLEPLLAANAEELAIYCAYVGAEPVGAAWIRFFPGARFADLHGGSVLPSHRGRGIYAALLEARVAEARNRGVSFLAVDAAPPSRPILVAKGFTPICNTTPYTWHPGPAPLPPPRE